MPGLDSRGSGNTFRYNLIEDNVGAGVRLGGHTVDGYTYGVDNDVYGNAMNDNEFAGIKAVVSGPSVLTEMPSIQIDAHCVPASSGLFSRQGNLAR